MAQEDKFWRAITRPAFDCSLNVSCDSLAWQRASARKCGGSSAALVTPKRCAWVVRLFGLAQIHKSAWLKFTNQQSRAAGPGTEKPAEGDRRASCEVVQIRGPRQDGWLWLIGR
jgi:hypothetical protein